MRRLNEKGIETREGFIGESAGNFSRRGLTAGVARARRRLFDVLSASATLTVQDVNTSGLPWRRSSGPSDVFSRRSAGAAPMVFVAGPCFADVRSPRFHHVTNAIASLRPDGPGVLTGRGPIVFPDRRRGQYYGGLMGDRAAAERVIPLNRLRSASSPPFSAGRRRVRPPPDAFRRVDRSAGVSLSVTSPRYFADSMNTRRTTVCGATMPLSITSRRSRRSGLICRGDGDQDRAALASR